MGERERREGGGGGRKSVIRSTTAGGACDVYSVNTRQQVRALHSPLVYTLSLEVGLEGGLHSRSSDIPPAPALHQSGSKRIAQEAALGGAYGGVAAGLAPSCKSFPLSFEKSSG